MFDFLKRKKNGEPQQSENLDYGRTVPLVPGFDDPLAGSVEIPVPVWNGGSEGEVSDDWYGPPGGGYGIPMDMPAGIPAMPIPDPVDREEATVAEVNAAPEVNMESTVAELPVGPERVQDYGATIPLVAEAEPLAGVPAYVEEQEYDVMNDNPTVGLPPHIVGEDSFVRVDTYTGPALVGEKGVLEGKRFSFRVAVLTLGVDYSCDVVLPLGTPGISRRHLRFWLDGNTPCAMDVKSTYGSFLNGEKMKPGLVYNLKPGDRLKLGGDENFRVE